MEVSVGPDNKWVRVEWFRGGLYEYRWGSQGGKYDLEVLLQEFVSDVTVHNDRATYVYAVDSERISSEQTSISLSGETEEEAESIVVVYDDRLRGPKDQEFPASESEDEFFPIECHDVDVDVDDRDSDLKNDFSDVDVSMESPTTQDASQQCSMVESVSGEEGVTQASFTVAYNKDETGSSSDVHVTADELIMETLSSFAGLKLLPGEKVVRGPHWNWANQDGGYGKVGTVLSSGPRQDNTLVRVKWAVSGTYLYRWGRDGKYDVCPIQVNFSREIIMYDKINYYYIS